ncbi:MAG TPA: lysophospholipid acyltransferase family protein [Hanamia sp.]|nr:lysophospholipid acyltransferase family protein [Hanamia sp.]
MRILQKVFRFFFSIYGFVVFLLWMFLLMPFFIYAFLQKKVKGGNLIYTLSRFWADAFFLMLGIRYSNIDEAPHDKNKEYIFVSNHISYLDIPMMMKVVRGQKMRILGKAEMNKLPVFGSIYKRGAVSVDRSSAKARSQSMKELIEYIHQKISVFICPEGTFNTTHHPLKKFYDGAFRIAIETQKPILPILFLDTYDRLNYKSIFSLNPGKSRSVHLAETETAGMTISDVPYLKEKIFKQMEDALIRYHASWIRKK